LTGRGEVDDDDRPRAAGVEHRRQARLLDVYRPYGREVP
jgi:hypothetical protein